MPKTKAQPTKVTNDIYFHYLNTTKSIALNKIKYRIIVQTECTPTSIKTLKLLSVKCQKAKLNLIKATSKVIKKYTKSEVKSSSNQQPVFKRSSGSPIKPASNDEVCKPKLPFSKFIYFAMDNRIKLIKQNPGLSITQVAKQCGEDWKKVSDTQMIKYEKLNQIDKDRYEKEMLEFKEMGFFTNSDGVNSKFMDKKHRIKEFKNGTIMPKKVQSPYMFYFLEQHNEMKRQIKGDEKYNCIEKTKEISEKWNSMTAQLKTKYEKLSSKDRERYQKQLDEIRKNEYFIMEDGIKSIDLNKKSKQIKKVTQ